MQITSGISNLSSIPVRSHSSLQNLTNNDHPWYTAEPNRLAITTFTEGLDASKTATPAVGSVYFATDTVKVYIAFTLNTWTQVDDVAVPHGAAQGDVLYYNGTNWARLSAGTSGQVLQTAGASANPSWASPSSTFARTNTQVNVVSSTAETTLWDLTLGANQFGANNGIALRYYFSNLGTASGVTVTYRLYFGGSVISTLTAPTTVQNSDPGIAEAVIMNLNATNSQRSWFKISCSPQGTLGTAGWETAGVATAAVDTTTSQHVKLTVQFSSSVVLNTQFDEGEARII